jgi:hypothetical protein
MSTQEDAYNVITSLHAFKNCIRSDGFTIDLQKFIIAYKELIKYIFYYNYYNNYFFIF